MGEYGRRSGARTLQFVSDIMIIMVFFLLIFSFYVCYEESVGMRWDGIPSSMRGCKRVSLSCILQELIFFFFFLVSTVFKSEPL